MKTWYILIIGLSFLKISAQEKISVVPSPKYELMNDQLANSIWFFDKNHAEFLYLSTNQNNNPNSIKFVDKERFTLQLNSDCKAQLTGKYKIVKNEDDTPILIDPNFNSFTFDKQRIPSCANSVVDFIENDIITSVSLEEGELFLHKIQYKNAVVPIN